MLNKNAANMISVLRILLSLVLALFWRTMDTAFLILYGICGISDAADGLIARLAGTMSPLGSTLDSLGDIAMTLALLKVLLRQGGIPLSLRCLAAAGIAVGLAGVLTGLLRFRRLVFVHCFFCKLMGVALALLPYLMRLGIPLAAMTVTDILCFLGVSQMLVIQCVSEEPEPERLFIRTGRKKP